MALSRGSHYKYRNFWYTVIIQNGKEGDIVKPLKDPFETGFIGGFGTKTGARAEACGSVDELMAGLLFAVSIADQSRQLSVSRLKTRCNELIILSSDLARVVKPDKFSLTQSVYDSLLADARRLEADLPRPDGFILPCDNPYCASINVARTLARRAEREVLRLLEEDGDLNPLCCSYLNLLSSYLFAEIRHNMGK